MRLTLSLTRTGSRQRAQTVLDEHATILAAIRAQDGEHARVAMQFHLAGRGTGWWTASATERGIRIFTTQARHNKRRGPRADK